MKRIIQGKKYDTATADLIASWSNHLGRGDFRFVREALYRTPRGNYFLAGEGGPMTSYAEAVGDMMYSGCEISPLTPDGAREWLELHGFTDELEEYFSDSIEEA